MVEATEASEEEQEVRCRWELRQWYDWATGDHIEVTTDPHALVHEVGARMVRRRSADAWNIPKTCNWNSNVLYPRCGTEMAVGGCEVAVSFIVFQWGAAKIGVQYDSHSWGESEGSTVSNRFIQKFFQDAVIPKYQGDYEVLTVFIQHSDEFAGISAEFLASLCRGRSVCALYFLWPIQGYQSYGEKLPTAAAYVTAEPFYALVSRMEAAGIPTRWPHPVQLWEASDFEGLDLAALQLLAVPNSCDHSGLQSFGARGPPEGRFDGTQCPPNAAASSAGGLEGYAFGLERRGGRAGGEAGLQLRGSRCEDGEARNPGRGHV